MSALAARRAAQLANASAPVEAEAPPAEPATPKSKPKRKAKGTKVKPPSPVPVLSPSPSLEVPISEDDQPEPETSKKRKVTKSARYYPTEPERKPKRQRAFSPSAPQSNGSSGDEDEEDDEDYEIGGEDDAGLPGTGAATPWSSAPSPQAGPSRSAMLRAGTSRFEAVEGVNLLRITESKLSAAGITVPGPGVVISLGPKDELLIAGTYTLTPLRQALFLLSTTIQPSAELQSYPIFAPTSHPLPVLTASNESDIMLESPLMSALKLPKGFDISPSQTIFLVQEYRCGMEGLRGDVVPGFNSIWVDDGSSAGAWGLRGVHPILDNFPMPVYPHCTPPTWQAALNSLSQVDQPDDLDASPPPERVPIVLVKGPKRSGKSSLARAALNTLLTAYDRVAWLECDLGQGEFGCGGVIGLWVLDFPVLGPSFSHPRVPTRAHYLGELSPQSCPDEYMEAIHNLILHYQYEVQYPLVHSGGSRRGDAVPLVVNTQGWVKGLGEDLLRAIETAAEPTHVFAFEALEEYKYQGEGWTNSPVIPKVELLWEASNSQTFTLESAPASPLQARYTAADMRSLSTITYMHARLSDTPTWDFSSPLFAIPPWTVSVGSGQTLSRAFLLGESADAILPADLPLALNGSVVGLIEGPEVDTEVYLPGSRPPVDDSTFLGLALIRAVKTNPLQVQIITPLTGASIARARYIASNGAFELPTPALLDFRNRPGGGVPEDGLAGVRWDDVPFFEAAESGAVGADKRRFRRNLQRKTV